MIRSAFFLCAGIIAAACFACAPAPPPGGSSPVTAASATCPDKSAFLAHVKFVQDGYTPSVLLGSPPPGIGTPIAPGSTYAQGLQNAFLLAPPGFQTRLCGLTGIYVNGPTGCGKLADCISNSWGYREWRSLGTSETYIAIPAGLWNQTCSDGSTPYVYHCFETDLLSTVLGWTGSNPPPPQFGKANASADTFDMTVLAALAHEVGHVRWYQVMSPSGPGVSVYNPNNFCTPGFFSYSWAAAVQPPPAWRLFLNLNERNNGYGAPDSHLVPPQISQIDAFINSGDMPSAASLLEQLYRPVQPWPSYFGAIAPDEDFVETYKFYILTTAQIVPGINEGPLTSLPIVIAGVQHDIPKDYLATPTNKTQLYAKTRCIAPVI